MLKSKRIFVVDDEKIVTEVVNDVLEKYGASVKTLNIPGKAVGLIREWRPNLIILDRHMPDVSGLDILKKLKDDSICFAIPVIMLTAANKQEEILEAIRCGAEGYIVKPFKLVDLVKQVETVMKKGGNKFYVD